MQDRTEKNPNLIAGATGDWEVVIGLEVHAQVASNSKLFSGASTEFGGEPNSHVSLVDAAMPGMLPVINDDCVAAGGAHRPRPQGRRSTCESCSTARTTSIPTCRRATRSASTSSPIVGEGEVEIDVRRRDAIEVGIERLHLEQDAGKSIHDQHPDYSYVDLNRSGVALMEIVSKPDMRSAKQAQAYVTSCAPSCAISAPATATWRRATCAPTSTSRCAGRATSSARAARSRTSTPSASSARPSSIEARRQIDILEDGGKIDQETRLFDPGKGETRSMRSKEEAHDYRYFPDPDLLPLELDARPMSTASKQRLPELPDEKKRALHQATTACRPMTPTCWSPRRERADYFEAVAKGRDGKIAANWVINELFGRLNKDGHDIDDSPSRPRSSAASSI